VSLLQFAGLLALLDLDIDLLMGEQEAVVLGQMFQKGAVEVTELVHGTTNRLPVGGGKTQVKWGQVGRFLALRALRGRTLRRWGKSDA
ncbi:unnamed protein product, partial [Symbiodinium pilosum]